MAVDTNPVLRVEVSRDQRDESGAMHMLQNKVDARDSCNG